MLAAGTPKLSRLYPGETMPPATIPFTVAFRFDPGYSRAVANKEKSEGERARPEILGVRFTQKELAEVKQAADKDAEAVSTFVRRVSLGAARRRNRVP